VNEVFHLGKFKVSAILFTGISEKTSCCIFVWLWYDCNLLQAKYLKSFVIEIMSTFEMGDGGIQHIDFSAFDDMDPSLADGFRIIYDREV
jgi:hypothetical protein